MRAMVAAAMCQGALGLSTGLFYAPQSFARTEEVVALAREAGRRGGVYDSHIRDESSYTIGLAAAVDEAIAIGREARLPVNISHIKALGVDVHGQAPAIIARVEAARRAGQAVTADQYPWSASGTSLAAVAGPALGAGRRPADAARAARRSGAGRAPARRHGRESAPARRRGGAAHHRRRASAAGPSPTSPKSRGEEPVAAAIAVIRADDPAVASFNQTEPDIKAFMRRPWVMTGSDASAGHPRDYGSFARKYSKYVRRPSGCSPAPVHRAKLVARRRHLRARGPRPAEAGRLRRRRRLRSRGATPPAPPMRQPTLLAAGVRTVLVNGVLAVDNGVLTGRAAGRALPHRPPPGTCP